MVYLAFERFRLSRKKEEEKRRKKKKEEEMHYNPSLSVSGRGGYNAESLGELPDMGGYDGESLGELPDMGAWEGEMAPDDFGECDVDEPEGAGLLDGEREEEGL